MLEVLQAGRVARVTIFYAGAILLWEGLRGRPTPTHA